MEVLAQRPNVLFVALARRYNLYYKCVKVLTSLHKEIYHEKLLKALLTKSTEVIQEHERLEVTKYTINKILHNSKGPAVIVKNILSNNIVRNEWWYKGKKHRDENKPAIIVRDPDIRKFETFWFSHGQLHRDDGPAYVVLDDVEIWFKNGKRHCDDGPALTHYGRDGFPVAQKWYKYGKLTQYNDYN